MKAPDHLRFGLMTLAQLLDKLRSLSTSRLPMLNSAHNRPTPEQREELRLSLFRHAIITAAWLLPPGMLSLLLPSCAGRTPTATHEQLAERMHPGTYTDSDGWQVPVATDTARVAGW